MKIYRNTKGTFIGKGGITFNAAKRVNKLNEEQEALFKDQIKNGTLVEIDDKGKVILKKTEAKLKAEKEAEEAKLKAELKPLTATEKKQLAALNKKEDLNEEEKAKKEELTKREEVKK